MKKIIYTVFLLIYSVQFVFCANMVEISVEVTEINNTKATNLGVNWLDSIQVAEQDPPTIINSQARGYNLTEVGEIFRNTNLYAQVRFLQEKGAAQILSKPKLLTKTGTKAKAHIGGEFAVVSSGVSGGNIEWKEYGIILGIIPTILKDNYIDLKLETHVSRLDWSHQVQNIPSLVTRNASSHIEIKTGQTITIAGLTETKEETFKKGLPLLGSIPILEYFFSYKTKNKQKSTILIFVTPKIVRR